MKYKLILSPFAELDLEQANSYYNIQREGLEDEFIEELENSLKRIKNNPKQYPKVLKEIRKANVRRFPYGIFYVFRDNVINILAIFHFSRNPKIWKSRYK
ncbi:MAG: type II toxin-antitoxin system RelE/ParE family toxin [Bacteroidales bacterium]|nr:type II toxin-antitoxin system RelE/ParE family toxin [Bacteroidales bacterium]